MRSLLLNPERRWQGEMPSEIRTVAELSWSTRPTLRAFDDDDATVLREQQIGKGRQDW